MSGAARPGGTGKGAAGGASPVHVLSAALAACAALVPLARAADEPQNKGEVAAQDVELLKTDSRAPYVHRLTLYDHDGKVIDPNSKEPVPYSPAMTCGKCHPYGQIAHGWHFNARDKDAPGGRRGEPWLLVDPQTGTVLPISGRRWPGTYTPEQVGLTNWQFVLKFGAHTPGGGFGEPDKQTLDKSPEALRWAISGQLEIDCLFCHSADQQHDPAEAARQIEAQNFKWAPTVAFGLAVVRGEARKAPDDWDPSMPPDPDHPERTGPKLMWDKKRFDADNRVLFNITRRMPVDRCYFCHSFREVGPGRPDDLVAARDVHLAAGLLCVDCHRNGIDHLMTRGNDLKAAQAGLLAAGLSSLAALREQLARPAFTCEGCHLGEDNSREDPAVRLGGRYGAAHPQHRGLPPVHFEKLTCTACHSGPWPEMDAKRFQTALAHGLGLAIRDRKEDDPPTIWGPIFAQQEDGKIAPQRMVWPAYWARLSGENVKPILPDAVRKVAGKELPKPAGKTATRPAALTDEQIAAVLEALAAQKGAEGVPIYVRDGRAYQRAPDGKLAELPQAAAAPYCWSLAHDVRPAAQALGVRGCTDCHAADAPVYFGRTTASDAENGSRRASKTMVELRGDEVLLARAWALGFVFRAAFKVFGFVCAAIVALILLRHASEGFRGMDVTRRGLVRAEWTAYGLILAALGIQGVTGFSAAFGSEELSEWRLLIHMLAAPLFIVGLTALTLSGAPRSRFGPAAESGTGRGPAAKTTFWLLVTTGFIVMTSMLVAMVPVVGSEGQETLGEVHKYSALVLVVVLVLHTIVSLTARRARGKAR